MEKTKCNKKLVVSLLELVLTNKFFDLFKDFNETLDKSKNCLINLLKKKCIISMIILGAEFKSDNKIKWKCY